MNRPLATGLVLATLLALSAHAAADVPNPPPECVGKSAGDACSFQNGDTGTCQSAPEGLTCVVGSGSGGSGDGDGESDDGGCSLAPGGRGSAGAWLLLGLAGVAAASRRRR